MFRYSVYDEEAGEYDNYESETPPTFEQTFDNLPFQVVENFSVPLPQEAYFVSRTELPAGPGAIIAKWTERELHQPDSPEMQAQDGTAGMRILAGAFLSGVVAASVVANKGGSS